MKKFTTAIILTAIIFCFGCDEQRDASRISAQDNKTINRSRNYNSQQKSYSNCPTCGKLDLTTTEGLITYLAPLPAVWDISQWQNEYGDGIIIETRHYRIYTTLFEPLMLKQIPAFVEAAFGAYQNQLPSEQVSNGKSVVYIFANRRQWEAFTTEYTGLQYQTYLKIKKGAYYLNGSIVAYNIGRSRTFSILGHEGWHQFCDRFFKYKLPSWLDEGIAQTFEASNFESGQFVFYPARNYQRLGALKLTIEQNKFMPLAKLISLNPGQVVHFNNADSAVMAFYAQSYALVRFLREDNYGKRLSKYQQMLSGAKNGTWPLNTEDAAIAGNHTAPPTARWNSYIARKLFDIYINEDIEQLQAEYIRFCNKIIYHIRVK